MNLNEIIIKIDFEDRAGLGYEIFEVCEKNDIDKVSMEVSPDQGMFIKLRVSEERKSMFLQDLKGVNGVIEISFRSHMPYESREHNLNTILNAISEGVVAIDDNGKIKHINKLACQIFDCTREEALGLRADELFDMNPPILDTLSTGRPYRLIERKIKRNQKLIRILTSSDPILDPKGSVIGAVATIKDFKDVEEIISKVDIKSGLTTFDDIIYQSSKMRYLIETARTVARGNSTIILRGESGTGKELFARSIHMEGNRANAPFIAINCGALPDTLLESELFGYVEGAFTGALKGGKKGIFEQADNGTIFLDEIGEISPSVQVRLLRVLQEGAIRRVGGTNEIQVNVRIITATHRNLEDMIKKDLFREDLYYRLNVIPLTLFPLRERVDDIQPIAQHLVRKISGKLRKREARLTKESIELLKVQEWPGNVRQLENVLERVINMIDEQEITPQHFYAWTDLTIPIVKAEKKYDEELNLKIPLDKQFPSLKEIVAQVEQQVLLHVLKEHKSSRKAGRVLGVSNTTILNKMNALGIKISDKFFYQ
ncbi:sigma 54-interacting transcriptional regulator [Neobacillus sp. PS3-40]|uniref:sigma-54 interaction domain-containing protein n=1 Tax=Neobacillus sp. PS3-40 TaxID=3070679 RepID=UPI0027E06275|nr:sigma 54-interacting transcriptional regulator [Neobacillus sp. PS3-40]WML43860.1 sigma 54-interacting transcriptional regulator [Neobacillus sp. PS3-40]